MKRLLSISERNSKRILSMICLVLALFVPGCIPVEDIFDQIFDPACPYQMPFLADRCVITYRTKFGQQKDVSVTFAYEPQFIDAVDCVEITSVSCSNQ